MKTFVFLDSSRTINQSLQQIIIKDFVQSNNLSIDFYGAEFTGTEHYHHLFLDYLQSNRCESYLFFTIKQFRSAEGTYNLEPIRHALSVCRGIFFASERISLLALTDLLSLERDLYFATLSSPYQQQRLFD